MPGRPPPPPPPPTPTLAHGDEMQDRDSAVSGSVLESELSTSSFAAGAQRNRSPRAGIELIYPPLQHVHRILLHQSPWNTRASSGRERRVPSGAPHPLESYAFRPSMTWRSTIPDCGAAATAAASKSLSATINPITADAEV